MDTGDYPAEEAPSLPHGADNVENLTLKEAAAYAQCSEDTLRRAVRRGALPRRYMATIHGPELVIARAEFNAWLVQTGRAERALVPDSLLSAPAHDAQARSQEISFIKGQGRGQGKQMKAPPEIDMACPTCRKRTAHTRIAIPGLGYGGFAAEGYCYTCTTCHREHDRYFWVMGNGNPGFKTGRVSKDDIARLQAED